jgi:hypothetical protein
MAISFISFLFIVHHKPSFRHYASIICAAEKVSLNKAWNVTISRIERSIIARPGSVHYIKWLYSCIRAEVRCFSQEVVQQTKIACPAVLIKSLFTPWLYSPWRTLAALHMRGFLSFLKHLVGLLGRAIGPSQGLYLHKTAQYRQTRSNICVFSGIRTHDSILRTIKTHAVDRAATVITSDWDLRRSNSGVPREVCLQVWNYFRCQQYHGITWMR